MASIKKDGYFGILIKTAKGSFFRLSKVFLFLIQVFNASEELAMATKFSNVRVFQAALKQSSVELNDLAGVEVPWSRPTPGMTTDVQKKQ